MPSGKILKYNTFVSDNPPHGNTVALLAGTEVPDWAWSQLEKSDHLFEDGQPQSSAKAPEPKTEEAPEDTPAPDEKAEEPKVKVPKRSASRAAWVKFAEAISVKVPDSSSRDEIIERVEAAHPDLFDE